MTTDGSGRDLAAWTEPGVEELAAGAWRIPLPLPIDGLSTVNAYLFTGGDDVVLVDPGWATKETATALRSAFDGLGGSLADVTRILATHTHLDHYSHAMQIRAAHGIPVAIGEEERHTVEAYVNGTHFYAHQVALLEMAGAPELAVAIREWRPEPYETDLPFEPPDQWLSDGERIRVGDRELTAIATPGHTRGHIAFADTDRGLLVTGDHILPRITPAIGFEYLPEALPLTSFLASLALIRALPDAAMLPAHGNVAAGTHERIAELIAHHEERFAAVEAALTAGDSTAYEVASRLRWTRRARALSDLAPVHQMTAVLEVAAHLHVLELDGRVRRRRNGDVEAFEAGPS